MAELTRDDVRQAVRNELSNVLNDIHYIRESSSRIDQRTSDLDMSQQQIANIARELQQVTPALQALSQLRASDIQDIKLRVQNIEKGIAQIVQYLQATEREHSSDGGYRGV